MTEASVTAAPHLTWFFDRGFAAPTLVALNSVLRHMPGPLRVTLHPTDPDISAQPDLDRFRARYPAVSLTLAPVDMAPFRDLPRGRLPLAARARLLLPQLHQGRVLYLDGDVIARRDLSPLWQTDLAGHAVGACLAPGVQVRLALAANRRGSRARAEGDKLKARGEKLNGIDMGRYFNSGVMLFDLDRIRALGLDTRMADIAATAQVTSRDQDWLNIVFHDSALILPPEWNSGWGDPKTAKSYVPKAMQDRFRASRDDPAIVHFTGFEKPWAAPRPPFRWRLLLQPAQRRARARFWAEFQALRAETEALLGRPLFGGADV